MTRILYADDRVSIELENAIIQTRMDKNLSLAQVAHIFFRPISDSGYKYWSFTAFWGVILHCIKRFYVLSPYLFLFLQNVMFELFLMNPIEFMQNHNYVFFDNSMTYLLI